MARIQIIIDYNPDLKYYPDSKTKAEALQEDVDSYHENTFDVTDMVAFAESVEVSVIETDVD
jgi:hypothetical protein